MRDQVVAEVMAFEDQKLKDKSIESMIQALSFQDPDGAEALIAEIGETDPKKLNKYKQSLLSGMRMYDPEAALDYSMNEFSEEKAKNKAVTSSFGSLASQDAEAAQKWLTENGDDYDKDKLIGTAMNRISWQSPDKAMDWALQTYDDDKRSKRVIQTYEKWEQQHEAGAKEWLSQQDEDTQAAILEGQSEEE